MSTLYLQSIVRWSRGGEDEWSQEKRECFLMDCWPSAVFRQVSIFEVPRHLPIFSLITFPFVQSFLDEVVVRMFNLTLSLFLLR